MMPIKLPKDATLYDLSLSKVEGAHFVRSVIGVMHNATKEHGAVFLRLGVTGTGVAPNYRIEDGNGRPYMAIDGANHKQWPSDVRFDEPSNWSEAMMSQDEVKAVLAALTGYSK